MAEPTEDMRDRQVVDRNGDEIGDVNGLLLDDREKYVRFLEVASSGCLDLGKKVADDPAASDQPHTLAVFA